MRKGKKVHQKKCAKCLNTKPIERFGKLSSSKDGLKYRCKDCVKIDKKEYRQKNPDKIKDQIKRWAANNPEKARNGSNRRFNKWYTNNQAIHYKRCSDWYERNLGKRSQYDANRRVRLLNASVPLNDEQNKQILFIYSECKRISQETGVMHHVDHIFPLCGKNYSGLHVPWNLQIIPATDNLKKSNKLPDLPLEEVRLKGYTEK